MLSILLVDRLGKPLFTAELHIEPMDEMPPGLDLGDRHFAETPADWKGLPIYREVVLVEAP